MLNTCADRTILSSVELKNRKSDRCLLFFLKSNLYSEWACHDDYRCVWTKHQTHWVIAFITMLSCLPWNWWWYVFVCLFRSNLLPVTASMCFTLSLTKTMVLSGISLSFTTQIIIFSKFWALLLCSCVEYYRRYFHDNSNSNYLTRFRWNVSIFVSWKFKSY